MQDEMETGAKEKLMFIRVSRKWGEGGGVCTFLEALAKKQYSIWGSVLGSPYQ